MNVKKFFADLSSNGFAVMPNFWKAEKCDNLANKIRILMNEVDIKKTYENERYLVNSILNKKLKGYNELSKYHKAVIQIRHREEYDTGMIDIFNADKIFDLESFRCNEFINKVLKMQNKKLKVKNINIYINNSIIKTRDYHRDSKGNRQFKAFINLTDIADKTYGPYSYIEGSHRGDGGKKHFFECPKGTLVISNQSGLHRGVSQKKGRERIMLAANCVA